MRENLKHLFALHFRSLRATDRWHNVLGAISIADSVGIFNRFQRLSAGLCSQHAADRGEHHQTKAWLEGQDCE